MDVQPTNLQQLRDALMSIWTKISEECFQHLVESMPRRIKAVLKAKVCEIILDPYITIGLKIDLSQCNQTLKEKTASLAVLD